MPALELISAGLGAVQAIGGAIGAAKTQREIDKLKRQRKAYQTPEEIFQMLQATENRAQQGFDPTTLNYLTNQTDRAFDSVLGTAERLGADSNDLSAAFDQKMQGIFKIGAQNAALNMENFNKYYGALSTVAANDAAEQKSVQDMLNDDIQSAVLRKQQQGQNVNNGINTAIGGLAADQTARLYNPDGTPKTKSNVDDFSGTGTNPVTSISRIGLESEGVVNPSMNTDNNYALFQKWLASQQPNLMRR